MRKPTRRLGPRLKAVILGCTRPALAITNWAQQDDDHRSSLGPRSVPVRLTLGIRARNIGLRFTASLETAAQHIRFLLMRRVEQRQLWRRRARSERS